MAIAPNPLKSVGEGLGEVSASPERPVDPKMKSTQKNLVAYPPLIPLHFAFRPRFSHKERRRAQKITSVGPPLGLGIYLGSPQAMGVNNDRLTVAAASLFDRPSCAANRPQCVPSAPDGKRAPLTFPRKAF